MSPISRPPWKLLLVALPLCFYLAFELGYSSISDVLSSNNYDRSLEKTIKKIRWYIPSYQNFDKDAGEEVFKIEKSSSNSSINPNLYTNLHQNQNDQLNQLDWQPVPTSKDKFSVYSAYSYDGQEVIIISTTRTKTKESISCVFHYNSGSEMWKSTKGRIQIMDENWKLNYTGTFVHCPLPPSETSKLPNSVSIIAGEFLNQKYNILPTTLRNVLKIKYISPENLLDPPFNLAVCVLPAYKYNEVFYFLEWIEFYKLMGVQHFTLYNVSIGPSTSCILKHLTNESMMKDSQVKFNVYPWKNFPIKNPKEIRSTSCAECGLSPAGNDCIYKHKGLSKYMSLVDFDEFIMPRTAQNYGEMISFLDAINSSVIFGEYSFRNGFFPRSRANDKFSEKMCEEFRNRKDLFTYKVCMQLITVKKVSRQEELLKYHVRTKYIVKPEAVFETGNHHVVYLKKGYERIVSPPEIGFLRHYRKINKFWTLPDNSVMVPDRISKNFAVKLAKNVAKQVDKFIKICDLDFNTVFSQNDK